MTKKNRVVFVVLLFALALVSPMPFKVSGQSAQETAKAPSPIEMADSLAWKRIASPTGYELLENHFSLFIDTCKAPLNCYVSS
jgi:hypothetical protein